jgi:hypothetical protein
MAGKAQEHMEVVGSDGQHVGRVDAVEGDGSLKLTRQDPAAGGSHHQIPKDLIDRIDGQTVRLRCTADQARSSWQQKRES